MNNQELELKIKEILSNKNFFDMVESVIEFEKEYKTTDFFKKTKLSLLDVVKNAKVYYAFQLEDIKDKIQDFIDGLDFTNIHSLLGQLGEIYTQENTETLNILKEFKEIVK